MSQPISVLIPDGEEDRGFMVARCLAEAPGISLYTLSSSRWALSRFTRHQRAYHYVPVRREPGMLDPQGAADARLALVARLIHEHQIDVLMPISEPGTDFCATRQDDLSHFVHLCPVSDPLAFRTATDKGRFARFATQHGLPVPLTVPLDLHPEPPDAAAAEALWAQLEGFERPLVLKPTFLSGGRGIRAFDSVDKLRDFVRGLDPADTAGRYIVQEYVPGYDLGLSVLCRDGAILAHTVQQGLMAHCFGMLKAMQFVRQDEVLALGQALLSALRWSGVAHVDMRYDERDGRVKLIEVNGRYWGSLLGSLAAGVNFPYLACLAALGIPFAPPDYRLCMYFHKVPAMQEALRRLAGRQARRLSFGETGWKYFVDDPMPEVINIAQKLSTRLRGHKPVILAA